MWIRLIDRTFREFIRIGTLEVSYPDGTTRSYGAGAPPKAGMQIIDPGLPKRLVTNPELALGEGYMEGGLTIADDDLHGLLRVLLRNRTADSKSALIRLDDFRRWLTRHATQANPLGKAKDHVAHHYDISEELYDLFLDEDRQYSCAYFRQQTDSLDMAQAQKKAIIAAKLCLSPGQRVLDIGCGWGGLALTLARDHGVHVTGVTLSENQHRIARERVRKAGLEHLVDIRLQDYREVGERFDRVVSVGMFEHVGPPHYHEFFRKVKEVLAEDGIALLHTIGYSGPPANNSPWINKYIFPGGHVPSMSEVLPHLEAERMTVTDIEVWRLHYAYTLRKWLERFEAKKEEVLRLFDEIFFRMWRYYLVASEMTFRDGQLVVFQFQIAKRADAVPLTRDYLLSPSAAAGHADLLRRPK